MNSGVIHISKDISWWLLRYIKQCVYVGYFQILHVSYDSSTTQTRFKRKKLNRVYNHTGFLLGAKSPKGHIEQHCSTSTKKKFSEHYLKDLLVLTLEQVHLHGRRAVTGVDRNAQNYNEVLGFRFPVQVQDFTYWLM